MNSLTRDRTRKARDDDPRVWLGIFETNSVFLRQISAAMSAPAQAVVPAPARPANANEESTFRKVVGIAQVIRFLYSR